jgi:HK97 family phage portal protein
MPTGGNKTPISARFMNGFDSVFSPSNAMFSPGTPPITTDPQPVRRIDFPSGVNLNWTPRSYESFGFPQLRAFANVELVRLAIETRKDQIERLEWSIKPRKGRRSRVDADERIRKVERMFRKPDGVTPFASWLRPLIEDLLAIDAPTIERRRDRAGNLIGLDVIDGASIKVLVDNNGRRPLKPAPAYQQIIKGRIWADLTTDDIIYSPRNMRTNHMYGFSPVEQLIVTINTVMRRQTQQLAYFTEGNLPQGLINAPDGWTPDQIKEFQDWMDSRLAGNQAERSKVLWAPFGAKYQSFKEAPIKDDFDEWLARVICFCFSLPPTPFIRQMNRATSQEDQDRAMEEGLIPLLKWAKRLFDGVIQDDLGFFDLEFAWDTITDLDPKKQAEVHDIYLKNGTLSHNEVRDELGHDGVKGGEEPMIITANGAVPISMIRDNAETAAALQEKLLTADPAEGDDKKTDAKPKPKAKKDKADA